LTQAFIRSPRYTAERSGDRTTWRNGYRDRSLDTRLGTLNLKIPSCGPALTFRAFWNRGRPLTLVAVIQGVDCWRQHPARG
jgi:hypothetical protein